MGQGPNVDYLASKEQKLQPPSPAPCPAKGQVIFAIGDIHGRLDLLSQLLEALKGEAEALPPGTQPVLITLGDMVDRGPDSRGVVELLASQPLRDQGFRQVSLKGNHEDVMLGFLNPATPPESKRGWLTYGGAEALASYGLPLPSPFDPYALSGRQLSDLAAAFAEALPPHHRDFLAQLPLYHESGDYFFAHAGVDPTVPLHRQEAQALLWIRQPFLSHDQPFGKMVVHGHTISKLPQVRHNRIGLDTGAFRTDRLTCLRLYGTDQRFLITRRSGDVVSCPV